MTDAALHYQNRAFALRVIASDHEVTSKENRRALILAARTYERLAKQAEMGNKNMGKEGSS